MVAIYDYNKHKVVKGDFAFCVLPLQSDIKTKLYISQYLFNISIRGIAHLASDPGSDDQGPGVRG